MADLSPTPTLPVPTTPAEGEAVPPLRMRGLELRPVIPADYDYLRRAELSDALGPRWRHRGATPSPERFAETLWTGVLAQFIVQRPDLPVGVCTCYNADFQNGHAYIAAAKFQPGDLRTEFVEGCITFIEYVFACWNFTKLYLETVEFNVHQMVGGLGDLCEPEGRFRNHVFQQDRYWDLITLALYRDEWRKRAIYELVARRRRT